MSVSDHTSAHLELAPTPVSARLARRFVADTDESLDPVTKDTLLLLTSELVTNGVLHARTRLVLGLTLGRDRVLVAVADDNADRPVQPPVDNERASGRGILLLTALAEDWGVQEHDGGKTVWFTLPRAAATMEARSE